MEWNATFIQDGSQFFSPLREAIAHVIMEQQLGWPVETVLHWYVEELFETVYNMIVANHSRGSIFEPVAEAAKKKFPDVERYFHCVFRGPPATWLNDSISIRIDRGDLYIYYFRD